MTTAKSTSNDWLNAQQQYWDTWFDAQRKTFGAATPGYQNPWADFFKEWQNTVSNTQTTNNTEMFQQYFVKAGQPYMDMLQQFYQATGQAKPLDQMTKEWTEQLQKFYSGAFQANTKPFDMNEAFTKAQQAWSSAFAQMGQGAKDPLSAMDPLGFFASMPGIGYSREKQEQMNHLYQQWVEFERKQRDYNASMAKVGMEAVQKFQEFLANPPKDQAPLTSLKAVYAKWVDVCEEIYAKFAMTKEYTDVYGEVVNALMAFKKQQNKIADDMLEQFNMPTRAEIDSLHKQVHQLKRELAELKKGKTVKTEKPAAKKGKK